MRIALFHNPNVDKPYVGDELTEKYSNMARTSEWVDVEFPELSTDAKQAQLARIEAAKAEARRFYENQIERFDKQAAALS